MNNCEFTKLLIDSYNNSIAAELFSDAEKIVDKYKNNPPQTVGEMYKEAFACNTVNNNGKGSMFNLFAVRDYNKELEVYLKDDTDELWIRVGVGIYYSLDNEKLKKMDRGIMIDSNPDLIFIGIL